MYLRVFEAFICEIIAVHCLWTPTAVFTLLLLLLLLLLLRPLLFCKARITPQRLHQVQELRGPDM